MTSPNTQRALDFFKQWEVSYEVMCQSYRDLFTDDCVWINAEFPPTTGPEEAVRDGLDPVNKLGMETIRVDVRAIGQDEAGVVWSERIDHVLRADGSIGFSVPVVGVMEFTDEGRLRAWREYFDPSHIVTFMEHTEWLPEVRA